MTQRRAKVPAWLRRTALGLVVALALAIPGWYLLMRTLGESEVRVFFGLLKRRSGFETAEKAQLPSADAAAAVAVETDPNIVPFHDIGERLGDLARGNNLINFRGVAVFDANGDDRLDLYFPHSGRPVAMGTGDDGAIRFEIAPAKPNALFLNMGNDEAGDPIYRSVQEVQASGNKSFVREELLIENKYVPRTDIADDQHAPGRIAVGVVAADFNGDGRQDLYVLNSHHGLSFQTHDLGVRVYPVRDAIGREAKREPVIIRMPSFLRGERTDGLKETVELGSKPEPEGRNSLFLNRGDQDGDGIPEWEDVTDETGLGGRWASVSASVGDVDRDGDLDIYVANFLDPDFWGFGADKFAGNRNQLYINQLSESGELTFVDRALELGVAGLHNEEGLPSGVAEPNGDLVPRSHHEVGGRQVGEAADHSWAALLTDWNDDGYPDLAVANDISNRIRVYVNRDGSRFERDTRFDAPRWDGCWMGITAADLDGDARQDLFASNCGGQVMSVRNTALLIEDRREANLMALAVLNYPLGNSTMHNVILAGDPTGRLNDASLKTTVRPSSVIPPDMTRPENFAPEYREFFERGRFATSLAAYEFAWAAAAFDVDNDSDPDLYWTGALARGNDGFIGDWTGGPGRLLVNESTPGSFEFRDRTLDYRLLDIAHVNYDAVPPSRPAPGTGWHKRDTIYLTDTDAYSGAGARASKSATRDIFRMHEFGNAVVSADLNGDGWRDIIVTHGAGYDSIAPTTKQMKVDMAGQLVAVPAPNRVMHPPTVFEEGGTTVNIHGGPPKNQTGHWVSIVLQDPNAKNRDSIGARVRINGERVHLVTSGGVAFSSVSAPLHAGLGAGALEKLDIRWGSGDLEETAIAFNPPLLNQRICISRDKGHVPCAPKAFD